MIVIIGAGPAGLAAAHELVKAGLSATIIDHNLHVGGQYWRHKYGEDFPEARFAYLIDHPQITWLLGFSVWQIQKKSGAFEIHLAGESSDRVITASSLIVATGAIERVLPTKGWTTAGALTAGGLQSLAKGHGLVPGKKVVIAGSGVFAMPVAQSLSSFDDVEIVAIIEARSFLRWWRNLPGFILNPGKIVEALGYLSFIARSRIPIIQNSLISEITSDSGGISSISVHKVDSTFKKRGDGRTIDCDLVASTFGFIPDMTLPSILGLSRQYKFDDVVVVVDRNQQTSIENVYAAGEVTGIGGHELAMTEGALAGLAIAQNAKRSRFAILALRWRRLRQQVFADGLYRIYRVPQSWVAQVPRDTTICRCEEVSLGEIIDSVEELGADSARVAKLFTRAGMGLCQGRICQRNVADIATHCTGAERGDPNRETMRPIGGVVTLGELSD